MKPKLTSILLLLALLTALLVAPATAGAKASASGSIQKSVTGTIPGVDGTFTGTLKITGFKYQNGVLSAVGTLTGTLKDALGNVIGTVTDLPVTLPLTQASGTCEILRLELGPVDLDLLGLKVHLDKVVLDITAQSGPGKLLGNLLCAVAHLLDSNASGNALANLLNKILGQL